MATPDTRQRPRHALRRIGGLVAVVCLGLAARLVLLSVVDVGDLPGAGGVVALYRLLAERPDPQPYVQLLRAARWLTGPDPVAAARLVSVAGSMAMVLGAAAGGAALDGRRGAAAAAGVAGVWSLAIVPAILIGPDSAAFGAAWLGAGLAWLGAARGAPGLVLSVAGIALVAAAVAVKAVALPAAGLLLLAPLLCRHPRWLLAQLLLLAAAAFFARPLLAGADTGPFEAAASISIGALEAGWQGLDGLRGRGLPEGALEQLLVAAAVGGLVPAKGQRRLRWLGQAALAAGVVVGMLALVGAMEPKTRPRYLTPLAFGVIVFAGALASKAGSWLGRLGWVPAVVVVGLLSLDSWAWLSAWDAQRVALVGNQPAALPAPPAAWQRRYAQLALHTQLDLSVEGGAALVALVEATPGGVAIPTLRDERHRLLTVAAHRAQHPSLELSRRRCCQQQPLDRCAAATVEALDAAGMALALPVQTDALSRINASEQAWLDALSAAATARGGLEPRASWAVRLAAASGGPLPCRHHVRSNTPTSSPR